MIASTLAAQRGGVVLLSGSGNGGGGGVGGGGRFVLNTQTILQPQTSTALQAGNQGQQQQRESLEQLQLIKKELQSFTHLEVIEKIGQGSFGDIFKVWDSRCGRWAALKFEKKDKKNRVSLIKKEASIMQQVRGSRYFAQLFDSRFTETSSTFSFIEMTFLGPNLENLKKRMSQGRFSLRTVLLIANQMISGLQVLHEKGIVHRDIKPENFVIGSEGMHHQIYVIDFGLSKYYLEEDGLHIAMKQNKGLVGTARYTSVQSHQGLEQSRRDDMESLAYLLLYFARGTLIWQNLQVKDKEERFKKIAELKEITPVETMSRGLPRQFLEYLTLVKALTFQSTPEYDRYRELFSTCYSANYTTPETNSCYDWCPHSCPYQTRGSNAEMQTRNTSSKNLGDSESMGASKNQSSKAKTQQGGGVLANSNSQQQLLPLQTVGEEEQLQLKNINLQDLQVSTQMKRRRKKEQAEQQRQGKIPTDEEYDKYVEDSVHSEALAEEVQVRNIPVFSTENNYKKSRMRGGFISSAGQISLQIDGRIQAERGAGGFTNMDISLPSHRNLTTCNSFNGEKEMSVPMLRSAHLNGGKNHLLVTLNQTFQQHNRDSSRYVNNYSDEWNSEQDEKAQVQTILTFSSTNELHQKINGIQQP